MSKDVDEQGWTYSTRFRSMHWHAEPDTWRSFVRRRKWVRNRIFTPKRLNLNSIGSSMVKKSEIDWESLRPLPNTVFNLEDVIGMKKALSLLPISSQRKDDIYSANNDDIRDPFLSWSMIRLEGESIFSRNRPNRARESTPVEEESWKVAVIEINNQRVRKVLKSCRLDREKLGIWNWWLGFEVNCPLFLERLDAEEEDKTAEEREKDDIGQRHLELLALSGKKRNEIGKRPSLDDVWDLLEFRVCCLPTQLWSILTLLSARCNFRTL